MSESVNQQITIDYTNHRGERATRRVVPKWIFFGQSPFHDGNQWFLEAYDVDKQAMRSFAVKNIHEWTQYMEKTP